MNNLINQAQPPLEFLPPALNLFWLRVTQIILPLWRRSQTSIVRIEAENVETLVDLYEQFQAGKVRFLMAFRHPSADDPICMLHLLSQIVPQVARKRKVALKNPIHAHFIYDRGLPLWVGSIVGWLLPRLGGTPIQRGKLDRVGLRSARDLFVNGSLPMAAAPEGATNGHNEIVSPLEPGIAQMGFWCVEDLLKAGRNEQVFIVPIGIQYRYLSRPWKNLEKLLRELESDLGLPVGKEAIIYDEEAQRILYQRLYRLGEHLLRAMEKFYAKFYHQKLLGESKTAASSPEGSIERSEFAARLRSLLDAALQVAEQYFNIQPHGTEVDRCRRLEQAAWDCIYREDIKDPEALSPVERGLADRIAVEADFRLWHMRLVESFVAVTGAYVLEKPTAERFAETILLVRDAIARIKGDNPFSRPRLGKQWVQMTVGQPISVSQRWDAYRASRRGAKQAVADLTGELQTALEKTIV
ncbi:MAG: 1-acyl-sn-glycerol-3-phosphate acyltransferase [Cyanosarcina radialis HA8281-LM2]|jgi:1-acyl-sn-glycerol-3-phosphate acyltransferase|nr:1-acyl-sn-glycerol-3-phosphate acyltransferase [Cyanosarcina radialis HA8281-LM2]